MPTHWLRVGHTSNGGNRCRPDCQSSVYTVFSLSTVKQQIFRGYLIGEFREWEKIAKFNTREILVFIQFSEFTRSKARNLILANKCNLKKREI